MQLGRVRYGLVGQGTVRQGLARLDKMYADIKGYTFEIDKYLTSNKISELKQAIGTVRFYRLNFSEVMIREGLIFTETERTDLKLYAVKESEGYYLTYPKTHDKVIYSLAALMNKESLMKG